MSYPPSWRVVTDIDAAVALVRENPFAHFITSHGGLHATRLPFIIDLENGAPARLRGHLNAQNPQTEGLDGADALITFDGPASYVSPHWRADLTRGGTYDFEEVRVRGRVRVRSDIDFFRTLVNDLAALIEPQHAEIGDYPVWRHEMAPPGYVESRFPAVTAFEIEISAVDMISKLHQSFPEADRRSVADHLSRSHREGARVIAEKIRAGLEDEA